jgi:adenylosuccinate lyase
VIPRYEVPEIAAIWSDETRMANWLEIELLAVEAWAELGTVPGAEAAACRDRKRRPGTTSPRSSTWWRPRSAPKAVGSTSA